MIEKRIEALKAQIKLATHNLQQRIEDQQAVIAQLGEEQDDEEEACENIQEQLDQMKRDQKEKEDWLKTFWRSNVLHEAPFTRKNLQKRRNFGERQHEALFVLDTEKQEDRPVCHVAERSSHTDHMFPIPLTIIGMISNY